MAKTFRPYEPDQMLLMPPSVQEWVPEGHLVRFVSDLVDTLDLSAIEGTYAEERGHPPYHPRMMVKLLVYGYCKGVYSSRRIAERSDSCSMRGSASTENRCDGSSFHASFSKAISGGAMTTR